MNLLLVASAVLAALSEDVAREMARADPAGKARLLRELPARMAERPEAERRALAPLLRAILGDPSQGRLHAPVMDALVATGVAPAVGDVVRTALSREETALREAARKALSGDPGAETSGLLAGFLRADRSPRARALLALIIGERGARGAAAAGTLVGALSDPEPMVRGAAAEALARIYRECRGFDPGAWAERVAAGPPPPEPAGTPSSEDGGAPSTAAGPPSPGRVLADLNPRLFGVPLDRPLVVAVLDISRSMRGVAGDGARGAVVTALSLLPSDRRVALLAFDERLLALSPAPEPALPDAKERLADFVRRLPPGRRTEFVAPLRTAVGMARAGAGPEGAQVVILSDGRPTAEGPPLDDLLAGVEGLREAGVRIDAVLLGGGESGLLRHLVSVTGGRISVVED